MFQSFKRAAFISSNEFRHWGTGTGTRMHLWLQKNGWPANQFVDLYMAANPTSHEGRALGFELMMCDQYEWAKSQDKEALKRLLELIKKPQYRSQDRWQLAQFIEGQASAAGVS